MLTHSEINSTAVNISWSPPNPKLQNGLITNYTVKLVQETTTLVEEYNVNDSWIPLKDLLPFTNYTVIVSSFTIGGEGPHAEYSFMTAEDGKQMSPLLTIL